MIPNDFNVWFTTLKIKNSYFANILSNNELEKYFEDCWNTAQQTLIEDELKQKDNNIEELGYEKEELEWDIRELDAEKAGLESEVQTLLSRIVFLEEQINGNEK